MEIQKQQTTFRRIYRSTNLKLTRMRVLCRMAEPIPAKIAGRKSNDQRMPSGDATAPPVFPPKPIPPTRLSGQPGRQKAGSGNKVNGE